MGDLNAPRSSCCLSDCETWTVSSGRLGVWSWGRRPARPCPAARSAGRPFWSGRSLWRGWEASWCSLLSLWIRPGHKEEGAESSVGEVNGEGAAVLRDSSVGDVIDGESTDSGDCCWCVCCGFSLPDLFYGRSHRFIYSAGWTSPSAEQTAGSYMYLIGMWTPSATSGAAPLFNQQLAKKSVENTAPKGRLGDAVAQVPLRAAGGGCSFFRHCYRSTDKNRWCTESRPCGSARVASISNSAPPHGASLCAAAETETGRTPLSPVPPGSWWRV